MFPARLNLPVPDGPCCDNCDPDAFQVEKIILVGNHKLKKGRKATSSPEVESAVRKKLEEVREEIVEKHFPNQHFISGNAILPDNVLDTLAKRARQVTSVDTLLQQTRWIHAQRFGDQVVWAIKVTLFNFPDLAAVARETQAAEREQRLLDAAAFKELRARLVLVFEGCYNAVFSQLEDADLPQAAGRKRKRTKQPRRRCQIFLKLPRSSVRAAAF